jgi:Plasmid pRiA4b ORF-3-like protein
VANSPQSPGQPVFRLRIQLRHVDPVVWRRVLVPGSVRMAKLADMLIAAMGWNSSHLHAFEVNGKHYGMHFDDWPDEEIDEKTVTVLQALRDERRFRFDYDFGDNWQHDVTIESLTWSYFGLKYAVVLDGDRACPPDDVGGVPGYAEFVEAMGDPHHEEHEDYVEWVGGTFDPAEFDLAGANALCQKVR